MFCNLRTIVSNACAALLIFAAAPSFAEGFVGPDENIVCFINEIEPGQGTTSNDVGSLVCLLTEKWNWQLHTSERDDNRLECDITRSPTVVLPATGDAFDKWSCHDGAFWPEDLPVLEYGEEWSADSFECSMALDGIRCQSEGGSRFSMSRGLRSLN